eukprot:477270-Amphidinium_carterae.1
MKDWILYGWLSIFPCPGNNLLRNGGGNKGPCPGVVHTVALGYCFANSPWTQGKLSPQLRGSYCCRSIQSNNTIVPKEARVVETLILHPRILTETCVASGTTHPHPQG